MIENGQADNTRAQIHPAQCPEPTTVQITCWVKCAVVASVFLPTSFQAPTSCRVMTLTGTAGSFGFNRSLLYPGFAVFMGWAVILSDRHWLWGCKQVWSEKQILWRLCLLPVYRSSLPPYIPPKSSPFCTHTMFPIYLARISSHLF